MKNDALQGNNSCIFLKTQILYIVFINLQMFPIAVKAAPTLEHGRLIIKKTFVKPLAKIQQAAYGLLEIRFTNII